MRGVSVRPVFFAFALGVILVPAAQGQGVDEALEQEAQRIDRMIMCPVCPAETIDQAQVEISFQMRAVIREMLAEGRSREEILDYFVDRYGPDILAAPPKSGVNLLAWILPIVGVAAGLAGVFLVIRAMTGRGRTADAPAAGPAPESPDDSELGPYLEMADRLLASRRGMRPRRTPVRNAPAPILPRRERGFPIPPEGMPRRRERRMGDLGAISLWLALALAAYSCVGSVAGKLRGSVALVDSAQAAMYATVVVLFVSTLSLVVSFIGRDFEIAYVARHSDLAMPDRFTWVAFYAGNEGSLLYIAMVLSVMAAVAVWRAPERVRDALPYTTGVLMLVLTFFLAVMAFMANPFDKLPFTPPDGEGINPLLTHFGMFFHPPALMAGLVGISIPFAFALGSLLARKTGDEWVDPGRVWGIITWALLAGGLLLGSWWAYTILGWGGYWFWDPVENAAFMPWLALTAFIHSIMVQKRRGMFRMWNIALINVAFGLALYGMFMNRGGSVPSVHSFGESTLGWVFLLFLAVGVIVPFVIFFWRYPLLKSAQNLDSMLSREAAFLVNNLLLLGIAFVTLWGTVYPLISELDQRRGNHRGPALLRPGERAADAGAGVSHGRGADAAVAPGQLGQRPPRPGDTGGRCRA